MSWWSDLFKRKPTPAPPPRRYTVTVHAFDGDPINDSKIQRAMVVWDGVEPGVGFTDGAGNFTLPALPQQGFNITVSNGQTEPPADGLFGQAWQGVSLTHDMDLNFVLPFTAKPQPLFRKRTGLVRRDGRSWADANGRFYPLGGTLFWALSGWKNEPDRLRKNWQFLADMGFDYYRMCGDLDWAGQNSDDPSFEDDLKACINEGYDRYGLRAEITAFAGPAPRNGLVAAQKVANAVDGLATQKVLFIEAANEAAQNGPEVALVDQMVAILNRTHCLVAATTPMGDNNAGQWGAFLDARFASGATVGTLHLDRSNREDDWGFVRQPYDFRDRHELLCNNEGKGPRSSVSQTTSIPRLVTYRLISIMAGLSAFCLHNGAGVAGKVDPAHDRPANLWEVPSIDALMKAVRKLDTLLPTGLESWQKTTQHGGWAHPGFENIGNSLTADAIWSDGHGSGCSRCYGCLNGAEFLIAVYGIQGQVNLRNERGTCMIHVYDLTTGEQIREQTLAQDEIVKLPGTNGTDAAYLVRGIYV